LSSYLAKFLPAVTIVIIAPPAKNDQALVLAQEFLSAQNVQRFESAYVGTPLQDAPTVQMIFPGTKFLLTETTQAAGLNPNDRPGNFFDD